MTRGIAGTAADAPAHGLACRAAGALPRSSRQVVHGTPITPSSVIAGLSPTGFCISYWNRVPLAPYLARLDPEAMLLLDSGAFSMWMHNLRNAGRLPPIAADDGYWAGYYRWAAPILRDVPQAVLVVPDVIGGTEDENRRLMMSIPPGIPQDRCMGVWHLDEGIDTQLRWTCEAFGMVAFGSCGRFRSPGTTAWRQRVDQAMDAIEEWCSDPAAGMARPRVHMLRGLGPMRFGGAAFTSADSTNLARNHAKRAPGPGGPRAMQRRLEALRYPDPPGPTWPDPCPGRGTRRPRGAPLQLGMFMEA